MTLPHIEITGEMLTVYRRDGSRAAVVALQDDEPVVMLADPDGVIRSGIILTIDGPIVVDHHPEPHQVNPPIFRPSNQN